MMPRTRAGLVKFRPLGRGSRVALVAPASGLDRPEVEAGAAELRRLGFDPVIDARIFERAPFSAGAAEVRACVLADAWRHADISALIAVRGGYGSLEVLPRLNPDELRRSRTAFIGYSDVTSIHSFLTTQVGLASVHGVMVDRKLAGGPSAYDPQSMLQSLGREPLGELAPDGLETLKAGDAAGPLVGGTLTQLLASFGTPFEFRPPAGHVLFLDEVGERPYRLHRMLTQWQQAGRLRDTAAIIVGQLPRCDEPGGAITAKDVVRERLAGFSGPVLFGFPSGHTTTTLVSLPFGVHTRVVGTGTPRVVVEESAAE